MPGCIFYALNFGNYSDWPIPQPKNLKFDRHVGNGFQW